MSNTTSTDTLAAIVTANPGATRVLEALGLDYCCGGGQTLEEACRNAGIEPQQVLTAIGRLDSTVPADWASKDPAALVDHLESTHHAYLHSELPRLQALADKVAAVHGERHPELVTIQDTFNELRSDLEPHLLKEELVLFPMIRELTATSTPLEFHCSSVRNPISVMMAEHDRAGELLAELRRQTGGYHAPSDGCASYRALFVGLAELEADTHLHVHKENNLLFPAVVALEDRVAAG